MPEESREPGAGWQPPPDGTPQVWALPEVAHFQCGCGSLFYIDTLTPMGDVFECPGCKRLLKVYKIRLEAHAQFSIIEDAPKRKRRRA